MFSYEISTGELRHDGELIERGYSGYPPAGKNNPAAVATHNVGPIPPGRYTIGPPAPYNSATHGPYVLTLHADASNEMYGRDGFLMHSDSIHHPGFASQGCIILSIPARQRVWESGDHELLVL